MAIDPDDYTQWKDAQPSAARVHHDEVDGQSTSDASSTQDVSQSPTLFETTSLLSASTSRGSYYTTKSDMASTSRQSARHVLPKISVIALLTTMGAGSVLAVIAAPSSTRLILKFVGFYPGGIVRGSWAAMWQSKIGNVTSGSFFSVAQAVVAGGSLPTTWYGTAATVGGLLAIWVYFAFYLAARFWRIPSG